MVVWGKIQYIIIILLYAFFCSSCAKSEFRTCWNTQIHTYVQILFQGSSLTIVACFTSKPGFLGVWTASKLRMTSSLLSYVCFILPVNMCDQRNLNWISLFPVFCSVFPILSPKNYYSFYFFCYFFLFQFLISNNYCLLINQMIQFPQWVLFF